MKRIIALFFCIQLSVVSLFALTIPEGYLMFDNSKTQYEVVSFVFGSNSETYVLRMDDTGGSIWTIHIPQTYTDMYRFTFVGGELPEGPIEQNFNDYKEYVSKTLNLYRTATSDAQMNDGEIFVPETGDNWAQGRWMTAQEFWGGGSTEGKAEVSKTLPIVYVNTKDNAEITSTDTLVKMTLYIDSVVADYPSLGSAQAPIAGTIKGRGNWTWKGFDKKPYKIKFDVKHKVLGMPNNRHWCLMAHADDNLGFLRAYAGFRISKALQMRWTPRTRPVELVLNGQYKGLYFLTEHVRIASNRVKIKEQADNESRADSITGGWLVEIDNYQTENNIELEEGNGQHVMISLREPDVLTNPQRTYIVNQMNALNNALYGNSASTLQQLLDLDEAAKFYLVQEIMEDCESYHGSCFLYKDRDTLGVADKWKFGPVWDFGNAYNRHDETWIYVNPIWPQYWIGQLATWPEFQKAVKEQWWVFYHTQKDAVRTKISEMATTITEAAKNDAAVWRNTNNYCDNSNMSGKLSDFLGNYDWRINWLYSQWGEGIKPATWGVENTPVDAVQSEKILKDGQLLIRRNGRLYTISGQLIEAL